jgi:hypothetical protein
MVPSFLGTVHTNQVYFLIWVNVLAAGSGSAFPARIRIRVQESQISAVPEPPTQPKLLTKCFAGKRTGRRREKI